jgi:hypothetical protein
MKVPPDFMLHSMKAIEATVLDLRDEFTKMTSKDVEFVYDKLLNYYTQKQKNPNIAEPEVRSDMKQALIEEILNILDENKARDMEFINNEDYKIGGFTIPSLEDFYARIFKSLTSSARFWRKKEGAMGYLNYIENFV